MHVVGFLILAWIVAFILGLFTGRFGIPDVFSKMNEGIGLLLIIAMLLTLDLLWIQNRLNLEATILLIVGAFTVGVGLGILARRTRARRTPGTALEAAALSGAGYLHSIDVVEQLFATGQNDEGSSCLAALKDAQEGERKLSEGDFRGTLAASKKAEARFSGIPEAKYLLAICKGNMSAAYGGLKDYERTAECSREALAILADNGKFPFSVGAGHMNLGTALCRLGDSAGAIRHLTIAKHILAKLPQGQKFLGPIEHNLAIEREKVGNEAPPE